MKKTFPLAVPGKDRARVIEAIKHDVRKYVKRERRKTLPDGFTAWDFACRVGPNPGEAQAQPLTHVAQAIDDLAAAGAAEVYVEILAAAGYRTPKPSANFPGGTPAGAGLPPADVGLEEKEEGREEDPNPLLPQ